MIRLLKKLNADKYSWILILSLFLVVVEIIFADLGFLFPALFFGFLFYYGRKHRSSGWGKAVFWIGVIGLVMTALHMIIFKLIIAALFICLVIDFIKSKRRPKRIHPSFAENPEKDKGHVTIVPTLLKNKWFGSQETPRENYEWQDIDIQTGIGDTLIDLSHTILPKSESVIFIRHVAGRVRILVPYGVEAALRLSVVVGQADFFDHRVPRLLNESLAFQTDGYNQAEQKVKIVISAVAGSLEVRRK
ncbi:cell wall-active antibiotics response protein [Sporolactobacillus sp. THM7-7]|nr:cell wall-active antibiotics response protein [Sporolactobacillus sp. THM7-7]